MNSKSIILKIKLLILLSFGSTLVNAQTLDTYRWNISPFCNVITLTITQFEAGWTAVGSDDNCGLTEASPVSGSFSSIGRGSEFKGILTYAGSDRSTITTTTLRIDPQSGGGDWVDDAGHTGNAVFNPTTAPGQPRIIQKNMWLYVTPGGIPLPFYE